MQGTFQTNTPFEKRRQEARRIVDKYPGRVPVVCEISEEASKSLKLDKSKYLIPRDITVGQFIYVLRKRLKLGPEEAMFIFINNLMPATGTLISQMYEDNKSDDGFMYCIISTENTFG